MTWDETFFEVERRRVGGGGKSTGADQITFRGLLNGKDLLVVSRVRLNDPQETFMTSSGHRLRDGKQGDGGYWVDVRVSGEGVTEEDRAEVARMAQAVDERHVVVTIGEQGAIRDIAPQYLIVAADHELQPKPGDPARYLKLRASSPLQSKGKPVKDAGDLPLFIEANEKRLFQ